MAVEATEELDATVSEELATDSTEALDETEVVAEGDEPTETDDTLGTDGQPRDDRGRFAPKASDTVTADEATQVTEEVTEPEPEDVAGEPFSFKANKQDYPIEGAIYIAGEGLAIPDEHVPFVKQLLAEGAYYRTNWRNLEQGYKAEIENLKSNPQKSESEERAGQLLKQLDVILSDPEKLIEFAANLEVQGPALKERARAEFYESKWKETQQQTQTAKQREQEELLEQQKDEAWTETFQALKTDKSFAGFSADDWKQFEEEMGEIRPALFVVQNGETFLNEGQILKLAQRRASILSRVTQKASAVTKAVEFNAKRNPKAPAAVTANAQTSQRTETEEKPPANWTEWKRRNGLPV